MHAFLKLLQILVCGQVSRSLPCTPCCLPVPPPFISIPVPAPFTLYFPLQLSPPFPLPAQPAPSFPVPCDLPLQLCCSRGVSSSPAQPRRSSDSSQLGWVGAGWTGAKTEKVSRDGAAGGMGAGVKEAGGWEAGTGMEDNGWGEGCRFLPQHCGLPCAFSGYIPLSPSPPQPHAAWGENNSHKIDR